MFFFSLAASFVPNLSTNTASVAFLTSTCDAHLYDATIDTWVSSPSPGSETEGTSPDSLEVRLLERPERLTQIVPARRLDRLELCSNQRWDLSGRDVDPWLARSKGL